MLAGPEKLLLTVFGFLERWKRARCQASSLWKFIEAAWPTVADVQIDERGDLVPLYRRWSDAPSTPIEDIAGIMKMLEQRETVPEVVVWMPPGFVETPVGPMPGHMRDRIVLKMNDGDDLDDRQAWLNAVRRS